MGMGTAGIPRVSRGCGYECCGNTAGWIWQLRDSRGDGFYYGRNPALNHLRNIMIWLLMHWLRSHPRAHLCSELETVTWTSMVLLTTGCLHSELLLTTKLQLLWSTTTFANWILLSQSAYGHWETNRWLFCDVPSAACRPYNINKSVTATVCK